MCLALMRHSFMALSQEKETEILRKILKEVLKKTPITLNDVKRDIGNVAKSTGETQENVAEVMGSLYQQSVAETFDPANFFNKK